MANGLYEKAKEKMLTADLDMSVLSIYAALVNSQYLAVVDLAADDFWSDASAYEVGAAVSLPNAGKDFTNGVFDASDITFPTVTGDSAYAIILFNNTTVPSTSDLIAIIDTGTGLPVVPNGGDIDVLWDSAANKIFKL